MCHVATPCKPYHFESHNFLKLSIINIQNFPSNLGDCESFPEENFSDILAPYETNLDDSIVIHNFSVRGYLSLIQMDSITHMLMVLRFM